MEKNIAHEKKILLSFFKKKIKQNFFPPFLKKKSCGKGGGGGGRVPEVSNLEINRKNAQKGRFQTVCNLI